MVTKNELANRLMESKDYRKYAIKDAIDDIFEEIKLALEQEEKVYIHGFGTFDIKTCKSHPAVHPETKERIMIPSYKKVAFRPSEDLTRAIRKK